MRLLYFFAAMAFTVGDATAQQCSREIGVLDLGREFPSLSFGVPKLPRHGLPDVWTTQQGVVFLSNGTVAAYQVHQSSEMQPLAPRDLSGGGGKYILAVKFFSFGEQIKSVYEINLVTDGSAFSSVIPTRDGQFIVRTGSVLRLYSSAFQEITSKILPMSGEASMETWILTMSAQGPYLYAAHNEFFGTRKPSRTGNYLIDISNLELSEDHDPEDFAIWKLNPTSAFWLRYLPAGAVGRKETVVSVLGNNTHVAAEVHQKRSDPFDLGIGSKPEKILVFQRVTKALHCSRPITERLTGAYDMQLYSVSLDGTLATIEKNHLHLYRQ